MQDSCIFSRSVSWKGSIWVSWDFFSNMAVYSFLHSLCFSTKKSDIVYAFEAIYLEKDVRGVLAPSWVLMAETHGCSLGPLAATVNGFQAACRSRII